MKKPLSHRQLAGEMEIYCLLEELGAGNPVWLPNGSAIRDELEAYIRKLEAELGYLRVHSPPLAGSSLYGRSGHLPAFADEMFPELPDEKLMLRPMNCPHHHLVFGRVPRSHRELPLRLAEFGQVFRREPSGSLGGLVRSRCLCQNDAHIYLQEQDLPRELDSCLALQLRVLADLEIEGFRFRLSRGDPSRPDLFPGRAESWEKAERLLIDCLGRNRLAFESAAGEAAFYGPKIDVQVRIGDREESIASLQLDFQSAGRFGLRFSAPDGSLAEPWIIHRAPLGSFERIVACLLERHQGRLPCWLAPVQLLLFPVEESARPHCEALAREARREQVRALVDPRSGRLSGRLRLAHRLRPYAMLVVGEREILDGRLRLQLQGEKISLESCNWKDVLRKIFPGGNSSKFRRARSGGK